MMIGRFLATAAAIAVGLACATYTEQGPTGPGQDPPPQGGIDDSGSVTPEAYLDYLYPILQKEPPLTIPVAFSALRPVDPEDVWLREMVRICRTIRVDVWTDGTDWDNAKALAGKYEAEIWVKCMPFQLTAQNNPDDRYDLSQPMNNGIWRQLNRLTGLMDKWIERSGDVAMIDVHSELWPWPDETKYGTGSTEIKYRNRLHRYRAATAILRSYLPGVPIYWYYYSNVQKHPGDVWYADRSANHTNTDPTLSAYINPELYRTLLAHEWIQDAMHHASGFENPAHAGTSSGKPMVALISINSGYPIRSAPDHPEWSRMKGWSWTLDYADGNDYQTGAYLFRPETRGDSQAYLKQRIHRVVLYGSPWYMNGTCQEASWRAEFWRRFLIFCRGSRGAAIADLAKPVYATGN